jgi:hypothetical protein
MTKLGLKKKKNLCNICERDQYVSQVIETRIKQHRANKKINV